MRALLHIVLLIVGLVDGYALLGVLLYRASTHGYGDWLGGLAFTGILVLTIAVIGLW